MAVSTCIKCAGDTFEHAPYTPLGAIHKLTISLKPHRVAWRLVIVRAFSIPNRGPTGLPRRSRLMRRMRRI